MTTIAIHSMSPGCRAIRREELGAAFSDCEVISLQQGWRAAPEPALRPTTVRVAYQDDHLLVWAELHDADIFNPESRFNHPFFRCGDVFELFLKPTTQDAYTEFHVGPANQHFQLRIPSAAAFAAHRHRPDAWAQWLIPEPCFSSQVWLEPNQARWQVLATLPFASVSEQPVRPGTTWRFSFSRYDYTRGAEAPVLSSSSPHAELSFHRQQEWGTLLFA